MKHLIYLIMTSDRKILFSKTVEFCMKKYIKRVVACVEIDLIEIKETIFK